MDYSEQHDVAVTSIPFNPYDHLIIVKTVDGPKTCYPFFWRLHEFRQRYPQGSIQAEVVHLDVERDLVVVRATANAHRDLEAAGAGVGLQTGCLAHVDLVTERAKAQALLDLGIGCAWPVLFRDELETVEVLSPEQPPLSVQTDEQQQQPSSSSAPYQRPQREIDQLASIQLLKGCYAAVCGGIHDTSSWERFKLHALGGVFGDHPIVDEALTPAHLHMLQEAVARLELATQPKASADNAPSAQTNEPAPAPTVFSVRELFAHAYQVKPSELETRWQKFKRHFLKQEMADASLSEGQLQALHTIATQQYERVTTDKMFATTSPQSNKNDSRPQQERKVSV